MALGSDGSVYIAGNGIAVWRPSGQIETLLPGSDPLYAKALDVDDRGVVHFVQEFFGSEVIRITPAGQVTILMDASGDAAGNPLNAASDIAVANGSRKRIVVSARQSKNAFLIEDDPATVPLLGPLPLAFLVLVILATPAILRRALTPRGQ